MRFRYISDLAFLINLVLEELEDGGVHVRGGLRSRHNGGLGSWIRR
jgi:hypothetical protein